MPSLWMPNGAAEQILAEKAGMDEAKRFVGFRHRLHALDPRMDVVLCEREDPENDLRQGFYYLVRRNENGTVAMWEISNPDGSFREPADDLIDGLQKIDRTTLWDFRDEQQRKKRLREREAERKREEASERFRDECDYAFRVQHAFGSVPWKKAS